MPVHTLPSPLEIIEQTPPYRFVLYFVFSFRGRLSGFHESSLIFPMVVDRIDEERERHITKSCRRECIDKFSQVFRLHIPGVDHCKQAAELAQVDSHKFILGRNLNLHRHRTPAIRRRYATTRSIPPHLSKHRFYRRLKRFRRCARFLRTPIDGVFQKTGVYFGEFFDCDFRSIHGAGL